VPGCVHTYRPTLVPAIIPSIAYHPIAAPRSLVDTVQVMLGFVETSGRTEPKLSSEQRIIELALHNRGPLP
jgi:hypothetical protein